MRLAERARNIIVTPRTEWEAIAFDSTPTGQLITRYVLPLAAAAALAGFIGMTLIGQSLPLLGHFRLGAGWGLALAVYNVVMAVVFVYVVGFIIDALAPTFGGQRNMPQAVKLAAYSYTPAWLLGILTIVPALGMLVIVGALYGLYLLYLGLPRLMKNPPDKSAGYTALVLVCAIVVGFIISVIGGLITAPAMMAAGMSGPAVTAKGDTPLGKLDDIARRMEEAGRKMEQAQKSADPSKQVEAAVKELTGALTGGTVVEPVQLEVLKPLLPEQAAGLPRTEMHAERGGVGLVHAKVRGVYGKGERTLSLEVVDTGGAAGLMSLAAWAGIVSASESETADRVERLRREGTRLVREEISKRGGTNTYSVVLADRFMVTGEGRGVDFEAVKAAVNAMELGRMEALR